MPTTNSNIQFKYGQQTAFNSATKDASTIYFITDTNRLFVGESEYTRPVQHGAELPASKIPANSLFVKEIGTVRELYYSKDGTAWEAIAYLPAAITGGVFGDNTTGTAAYGDTVKIPKVTVDTHGFITAVEDVQITLPASDKVTTVTTSGTGNAVTTGSISDDGKTLTLTKGETFIPTSGGTFTGAVTLSGAPTTDLHATTKKYVDDSISSAISVSDAMVFKGTVGTSGTVASISAINTSSAVKGDTYKVITTDTIPAAKSFDSAEHSVTPGDLIVYMGESKFIYVPSGDEDVTTVRVAGASDTINVSTTAQTGAVVLGDAATKKVSTSTTLSGSGASDNNVPTELAVKTYVDTLENKLGTAATTDATAYATAAQGTLADNAMPKSGGTFTGAVTLSGDPTDNLHAATKKYVDDTVDALTDTKVTTVTTSGAGNAVTIGSISDDGTTLTLIKGETFIPTSGGTFTGAVTLSGAPTTDLHAATKKYVDDTVDALEGTLGTAATTDSTDYATAAQGTKADNAMPKAGGTFTGAVTLSGDPTTNLHAATKKYVDDSVSTLEGTLGTAATTDSTDYATAAQGTLADNAMPKSGGTFTGAVTLSGAPTANLHAATKKYVDDSITSAALTWKSI